jgi:hypothetical protein
MRSECWILAYSADCTEINGFPRVRVLLPTKPTDPEHGPLHSRIATLKSRATPHQSQYALITYATILAELASSNRKTGKINLPSIFKPSILKS